MSINEQINRIKNAVAAIKTAIAGKGVSVPAGTLVDGLADYIDEIEQIDVSGADAGTGDVLYGKKFVGSSGVTQTGSMPNNGAVSPSELAAGGSYTIPEGYHSGSGKVTAKSLAEQTDGTAAAGDILSGETAYVDGVKITGSMTDQGTKTATLDTSTTSYTIPAGKHSGSGKVSIATQEKSVTPSTSAQTVTPDSGKVLSKVSVSAVASATQATPSISVSSGGLITASATQEAGYVAAGTKSATKQLTTKGATTITPTSSVQTAVSAGTYCTGDIKVAAASGGKAVYTGTVTGSMSSYTLTVNVGVSVSSSDTFIMFYDATATYDPVSDGLYEQCANSSWYYSGGQSYVTTSAVVDDGDGSYYTKLQRDTSASTTLSGTSVTLKSNWYKTANKKYRWYLIKG